MVSGLGTFVGGLHFFGKCKPPWVWYRTRLEKVELLRKFLFPAWSESGPDACLSACGAEIFKEFAARREDINSPETLQIFDLVSIGRRGGHGRVGSNEPWRKTARAFPFF